MEDQISVDAHVDAPHTYSNLILTGVTLGVVHVLAGPDHLSALATLSVGVRECCSVLCKIDMQCKTVSLGC